MKLFIGALTLAIITLGSLTVLPVQTQPEPVSATPAPQTCPAGSYVIDYQDDDQQLPICKLEPTGCPYGDSIPLGAACDKHAPQPAPVQEPEPLPVMEGK